MHPLSIHLCATCVFVTHQDAVHSLGTWSLTALTGGGRKSKGRVLLNTFSRAVKHELTTVFDPGFHLLRDYQEIYKAASGKLRVPVCGTRRAFKLVALANLV